MFINAIRPLGADLPPDQLGSLVANQLNCAVIGLTGAIGLDRVR